MSLRLMKLQTDIKMKHSQQQEKTNAKVSIIEWVGVYGYVARHCHERAQ